MNVVESDQLVLRRLNEDDAGFVRELVNDPDWLRYIGDRGVRSLEDAVSYIRQGPMAMYDSHGFGLYCVVLKSSGASIGVCGLLRREWLDDPDLGYALLPAHRGQGFARESALAVLQHARDELGLARILAITAPANRRSRRLLDALGLIFQERMTTPDGDEVDLYTSPGH